jgi:hypothetical protein
MVFQQLTARPFQRQLIPQLVLPRLRASPQRPHLGPQQLDLLIMLPHNFSQPLQLAPDGGRLPRGILLRHFELLFELPAEPLEVLGLVFCVLELVL